MLPIRLSDYRAVRLAIGSYKHNLVWPVQVVYMQTENVEDLTPIKFLLFGHGYPRHHYRGKYKSNDQIDKIIHDNGLFFLGFLESFVNVLL